MKNELPFEEFAPDIISESEFDYVEVPISSRAFLFLGLASVLIIVLATSRALYLNLGRGSFFTARSLANVNIEKPIPAYRGVITDRYGKVLATNTETFSVFINAGELLKDRQVFSQVMAKLAETLGGSAADLETIVTSADLEKMSELPLIRNITPEQAIAVRGLQLPAVSVENDFRREYPEGPAFSAVLGYTGLSDTGTEVIGKTGLEHFYDTLLRGTDGVYQHTRDVKGTVLDERVTREPSPGQKLATTIDADLQHYFYDRLQQAFRMLGVKGGAGIALDPATGEILSLVSLPTYDNNIFMDPTKSDERVSVVTDATHPLFNRAINGSYSPGSTIKPLVALSALHEQVIDPNFQVYSPGYLDVVNPYNKDKPTRFLDWRPQGWVTVVSALARSSNVFFYEVGGGLPAQNGQPAVTGLGIDRLNHYWQKFGLGAKTGVDADSEATGFLPNPEEKQKRTGIPWRLGDTYNVAIGQGDLQVSPLQLINYIASIANNGVLLRPHFVPSPDQTLVDYSDWKNELSEVHLGMRDGVVKDYGTSHLLNDLPFAVAAKTGSAQIENNTQTNAFFVGYAPFEKPRIAIVVLIEKAKSGSLNAVPIAKDVLNWYYENRIALAERSEKVSTPGR